MFLSKSTLQTALGWNNAGFDANVEPLKFDFEAPRSPSRPEVVHFVCTGAEQRSVTVTTRAARLRPTPSRPPRVSNGNGTQITGYDVTDERHRRRPGGPRRHLGPRAPAYARAAASRLPARDRLGHQHVPLRVTPFNVTVNGTNVVTFEHRLLIHRITQQPVPLRRGGLFSCRPGPAA